MQGVHKLIEAGLLCNNFHRNYQNRQKMKENGLRKQEKYYTMLLNLNANFTQLSKMLHLLKITHPDSV
ncbi:hypothetical protein T11_3009 [Trichinella zimbabwensis]|uniref:Uncharacterized protein n=1 Tax=Trichinella zimbabwensis TaxID=268475 RepID=A0A0V1H6I4_9BILA|nr:hypothetical protein T11_15026 [Trichinella zimbabwensis]KRZ06410.1 hypothetical protein T11_3009 [Trichinella zimbabwensis]